MGDRSDVRGNGMAKWTLGGLPRRAMLPLLACLLAMSAAVLAAGCGGGEADSGSTGTAARSSARRVVRVETVKQDRWTYARARFNEMCAGCHTLADAGARGRRYNLDHASPGGVEETHVRYAIAEGEPGMPGWRHALSEREFEELVAYIVAVARRSSGDDYWQRQLKLRGEAHFWEPSDTEKLEAYARRLRAARIRAGWDAAND